LLRIISVQVDNSGPTTRSSRLKPFACDQCAYSARTSFKLDLHRKSQHLGERKYACDMCTYETNIQKDFKVGLLRNSNSFCHFHEKRTLSKFFREKILFSRQFS
jgi:hypothetical protein